MLGRLARALLYASVLHAARQCPSWPTIQVTYTLTLTVWPDSGSTVWKSARLRRSLTIWTSPRFCPAGRDTMHPVTWCEERAQTSDHQVVAPECGLLVQVLRTPRTWEWWYPQISIVPAGYRINRGLSELRAGLPRRARCQVAPGPPSALVNLRTLSQ